MGTVTNKPKGYCDIMLGMDCETTGLSFQSDDPSVGFQAISFGFVVVSTKTLKIIDKLYVEIKWDRVSTWNDGAEAVHGLSREYLNEHGMTSEEAAILIGEFIFKYWNNTTIMPLGHNVHFDVCFLKQLMRANGIELKFTNRMVDSFSVGFTNAMLWNSDELFKFASNSVRKDHNAMEDIMLTVKALRTFRVIFDNLLED
jgi:oligoribonuclease (3'-5' exoribonuclease)